jgi:hypothetical protein
VKSSNFNERGFAISCLVVLSRTSCDVAVSLLTDVLADSDTPLKTREAALRALSTTSSEQWSAPTFQVVISSLSHPSPLVQLAAVASVAQISGVDPLHENQRTVILKHLPTLFGSYDAVLAYAAYHTMIRICGSGLTDDGLCLCTLSGLNECWESVCNVCVHTHTHTHTHTRTHNIYYHIHIYRHTTSNTYPMMLTSVFSFSFPLTAISFDSRYFSFTQRSRWCDLRCLPPFRTPAMTLVAWR